MRAELLALAALAALAAPAAARARRLDQDFEFDDDADGATRRPRRYPSDVHGPPSRARRPRDGDMALSAEASPAPEPDDVWFEAAPAPAAARCVGCGSVPRAQFLCGSDNRTYSSLCRLDLHNCVRRPAPAVALACRGFCPCPRAHDSADERDEARRRARRRGRRPAAPRRARAERPEGEGCAPDKMADRLLDWFSVLMDEAGAAPPERHGFPRDCKPETRWMFAHLDGDGDALLSSAELYALRHDSRERCLRPFLAGCGAGSARGVSRAAWCGCLRRAARPCAALARHAPRGGFRPACDARGFYRSRQCHAALGVCWCVDAHGQELPGSRGKGAPACPGEKLSANAIGLSNETSEEAQAPADDEDAPAGSGDAELRF